MSSAAEELPGEVYGEKDALAEVLAWSAERPSWQQDALRRLLQQGHLHQTDIEQLVEICLDPSLPYEPLSKDHVATQDAQREPISLLRVGEAKGINALVGGQTLEFAPKGITIIYGDNGSGKSGYVRVLKHACRTRDRATNILRNVEETIATPQSAAITFLKGATEDTFAWRPDVAGHADLPSVSIFDSRSANIHVEKTNDVAYIPEPMKVLEALADACDEIKAQLEKRVSELNAKTPLAIRNAQLSNETAAGSFVRTLSASSNVSQLELLATLSDEERQRLANLEADLAQDPKRAAARIQSRKDRLDRAVDTVSKLISATSESAFGSRDALKTDRDAKASAAKVASEALFAASPLPEIGQPVWRTLWDAAKRYSDDIAYPQRKFPEPIDGSELCVLCQQPLDQEALDRRSAFEDFIKSSTKAEEERAEQLYVSALSMAQAARVRISTIPEVATLVDADLGNAELAKELRRCIVLACWRLRSFCAGTLAPVEQIPLPAAALKAVSDDLARRATQLASDANSIEHRALVSECRELKDRESLTALKADLIAEIDRRKEADVIQNAIKNTAKRPVTNKNKELSDRLITNALRGRFSREIGKLKLSRMPIELKKIKDQNAVSYFQVCLVEKPGTPVGDVFSEGEHRCVALAAFMAELVTSREYSGIVFDDPMSSLDHVHRRAVAARLVEEAAHRQVIIFTHDLAFLFELRREVEAKEQSVHYQTVGRRESGPGFVDTELPMKAKSASELAHALRSELKAAKSGFDTIGDARRTIFCKGIIEQLREAWDQGVADFVFPVLGRFDNKIKGNSLYKLAVLNEDDVKTVTAARGRLSEDLHASAETLNPETVSHTALVEEVAKLETWLSSMALRQKEAKPPITSYAGG